MAADKETKPHPFWDGFCDVLGRAFSLDFTTPSPAPEPYVPDPRPGWEIDAENLRGDWERVGECLWVAIGRVESDNPSISRGLYERHLHETSTCP